MQPYFSMQLEALVDVIRTTYHVNPPLNNYIEIGRFRSVSEYEQYFRRGTRYAKSQFKQTTDNFRQERA